MTFFHYWWNNYTIEWQFITIYEPWNSIIFLNFKTSLVMFFRPHPATSLSRCAYENRYVTHPLPIFSSYLFNRINNAPIHGHESSKPMSLIKSRIEYFSKSLLPRFSKIITIIFQVSVGKSFKVIWEWLHSWNWVFLISKFWQDSAYSNSLLRAIIACNYPPFFKIFLNFVHFCANFQIFCHFSKK